MGFTLITDVSEIRAQNNRLEGELKRLSNDPFQAHYTTRGFPNGTTEEAWYFKGYELYWRPADPSSKLKRYINFFGQGKPTIRFKDAFQLNVPHVGVDRKTKGGFLKSDSSVYLLHRGPLGGGRKDGNHNLCELFPALVDEFDDYGRTSEGILIPFLDKQERVMPEFLPTIKRIVDGIVELLPSRCN